MHKTLEDEYKTFMAVYYRDHRFWTRISAQVYLEMEDYEWAGEALKDVVARVAKGEFRKEA
jgi:hercynylcysteine S-oxide lyase